MTGEPLADFLGRRLDRLESHVDERIDKVETKVDALTTQAAALAAHEARLTQHDLEIRDIKRALRSWPIWLGALAAVVSAICVFVTDVVR